MGEIAEVFGVNWKLLVIQAVNFTVLLLALWYFLYRPVVRMLEKRQQVIEQGVRDAKAAEESKGDIEKKRDGLILAATKEAEELVEQARVQGAEKEREIVGQAQNRADRELAEAKVRAHELRETTLRESEKEIARLAILSAERILKEKTS